LIEAAGALRILIRVSSILRDLALLFGQASRTFARSFGAFCDITGPRTL
jgi:hypothetical protein